MAKGKKNAAGNPDQPGISTSGSPTTMDNPRAGPSSSADAVERLAEEKLAHLLKQEKENQLKEAELKRKEAELQEFERSIREGNRFEWADDVSEGEASNNILEENDGEDRSDTDADVAVSGNKRPGATDTTKSVSTLGNKVTQQSRVPKAAIIKVEGYTDEMQDCYNYYASMSQETVASWINKVIKMDQFNVLEGNLEYDYRAFSVKIAYEGFDPKRLAIIILKRMDSCSKDAQYDVHKMIQIGHERGNNIEKMAKSSKTEFKKELQTLKSRYCLVSKAGKNSDAITLSRVCMTFPHLSCSYMPHCMHTIVDYTIMEHHSSGYPKQMMSPSFASIVLPTSDPLHEDLLHAHLLHQFEFSKVISVEDRKKSAKVMYPDLIKYAMAAVNGSILSPGVRSCLLVEWGIIEKVNNITQVSTSVKLAADVFRNMLN